MGLFSVWVGEYFSVVRWFAKHWVGLGSLFTGAKGQFADSPNDDFCIEVAIANVL